MKKELLIALDYDGTITEDIEGWLAFIKLFESRGHRIVIVTAMYPGEKDRIDPRIFQAVPWIVTTERQPKRAFCQMFNINPDIGIDDMPESIGMGPELSAMFGQLVKLPGQDG